MKKEIDGQDCPACGHWVYESQSRCGSCGRDMLDMLGTKESMRKVKTTDFEREYIEVILQAPITVAIENAALIGRSGMRFQLSVFRIDAGYLADELEDLAKMLRRSAGGSPRD